jgi:hypothetical protein
MAIRAIVTLALLLPLAAHAEDMFRWRDARGRLHYSNDTEKVPAGAKALTKPIGLIGGAPIGGTVEAAPTQEPLRQPAAAAGFGTYEPCYERYQTFALPQGGVDFDRPWWYVLDQICGQQHDIEGWLRRAETRLVEREIGL